MSRIQYKLEIDVGELKLQIKAIEKLLDNTMAVGCLTKKETLSVENGLLNLLGTLRDTTKEKNSYTITSVCKEDILAAFEGRDNINKVRASIEKMTDVKMEYLSSKLCDDYCNQLFWDSLRSIFEDRFMEE